MVEQVGQALAEETKTQGRAGAARRRRSISTARRSAGRNFESYSEDPYLAARMAVAYITGLQSRGIGASVKHYVGNESEFERNTINSEVDERTLREIYLPALPGRGPRGEYLVA